MGNGLENEIDARTRDALGHIATAGGKLLRVEREPVPGPGGEQRSLHLRLSFDTGAIQLRAEAGGVSTSTAEAEAVLANADEDEPWWAVLGSPLTKVAPQEGGGCLMQFRADDASPKLFVLAADGEALVVRVVI
ncbi:MAG: hypothetical protein GY723_07825 [bacterium]|nr:hypothetical protein [bacterium]MCP5067543.1 hypothetical protein [bacterium]